MNTMTIVIIFIIVFAMIVGNLLMLKSSAKQKMPSLKDHKQYDYADEIEDDLYPSEKAEKKAETKGKDTPPTL